MSIKENTLFCITQIPADLSAADLRRVFSQHVESGAFICFHYRRRPQSSRLASLTEQPTCTEVLRALKKSRSRKAKFCTALVSVYKEHSEALLASFVDSWSTDEIAGEFSPCRIYAFHPNEVEFSKLMKLIELIPPNWMPQGNVGTPTAYFFNLIRNCQLSPDIIRRLQLAFPRGTSIRKYGNVPFDYSCLGDPDSFYYDAEEFVTTRTSLVDIHNTTGIKFSDPVDNDEFPEEWDRFESLHDDPYNVDRSANHSLKYESKIELKWEKGGPGLVHYTDEMFWRGRESVRKDEFFDEPASFDWDVDTRQYTEGEEGFLGPGGPDLDSKQLLDMQGVTFYRSAYAERVMKSYGWRPGARLGKGYQKGLLQPITAEDGSHPTQRSGFGFNKPFRRPRQPRCRVNNVGVYIRSVFDSPETVAVRSGESGLARNTRVRADPAHQVKYRTDWATATSTRTVILTPHAPRGFEGVNFLPGGLLVHK